MHPLLLNLTAALCGDRNERVLAAENDFSEQEFGLGIIYQTR